jgi:type IV secretory pathway ATPase VirB11/archaellum biosynthesis ATPase
VRDGGSVIVAASPQGAGKSTLAAALIEVLPGYRRKVYLRGMYESFDWVDSADPMNSTILVNEISPHLPIYAWGETVSGLLALAQTGFQVIATVHADSVEELIAHLASYPVEATASQLAELQIVVFLTVTGVGDHLDRRVGSIVSLALDSATGGLIANRIAV